MKWLYRIGLVIVFIASFSAGYTASNLIWDDDLDAIEADCEESGGVLARARSGYVCVVPIHQAI